MLNKKLKENHHQTDGERVLVPHPIFQVLLHNITLLFRHQVHLYQKDSHINKMWARSTYV